MNPLETWLTEPDGLATRLRALRTQAGLSGKELAARNRWQQSKVSRLENGRQMPSPADVGAWAQTCGADTETIQALLQLLSDVQAAQLDWKRRMRRGQEEVQLSYNQLVQEARLVRHFETTYVPCLLQTAEYARRVLSEMVVLHGLSVEDVAAAVATRMQRQQLLYDDAKSFEFILAEPVLHWMLCPPQVMRGQLDRLQTVIGVPNIRFGILPMNAQLKTAPQNAFQIYDDLAIVETFVGETTHRDDESATYSRVMDRLWDEAVTGEGARQLIVRAAAEVATSG